MCLCECMWVWLRARACVGVCVCVGKQFCNMGSWRWTNEGEQQSKIPYCCSAVTQITFRISCEEKSKWPILDTRFQQGVGCYGCRKAPSARGEPHDARSARLYMWIGPESSLGPCWNSSRRDFESLVHTSTICKRCSQRNPDFWRSHEPSKLYWNLLSTMVTRCFLNVRATWRQRLILERGNHVSLSSRNHITSVSGGHWTCCKSKWLIFHTFSW